MRLDLLPDDIIIEFILFHLYRLEENWRVISKSKYNSDINDRLINMRLVSKKFNECCKDFRLWNKLADYYGVSLSGGGVALNFCSVLRYDIAMCRRIIESRILLETFPRVLVGLFGIKTLLDLPIVSDQLSRYNGVNIFNISPRLYEYRIMRGWDVDGIGFIAFKYMVQGGLDFIGGEDGDVVDKDNYGIEIIFMSRRNGVWNSCGSRRSIYRSSFVGMNADELDGEGGPGYNWYPYGIMEFAIDRPYDRNWHDLRFRLFTPYCVDYIRRLISGEDLWDIIEYDGSYKEGRGGLGGAGKLVLYP